MLFDVESDVGDMICCYLAPDSGSGTPMLRVTCGAEELAALEANEDRPSLVAAGRHSTGRCGFRITPEIVPNLAQRPVLELREVQSGLSIYRRRPKENIVDHGLLRVDLRHRRDKKLDAYLDGHFQLAFAGVDRWGLETTLQVFHLKSTRSICISGRLMYKDLEYLAGDAFKKVCVLQDPFVELAETILSLQEVRSEENVDLREQLMFDAAQEYFSFIDLSDAESLARSLSRLPEPIEAILANPTTRMLASRSFDQTPNLSYISTSLQTLSSFEIVGIRERPLSYLAPLAELLQRPIEEIPHEVPADSVIELADGLRSRRHASRMLDMDLAVYDTVRDAVGSQF